MLTYKASRRVNKGEIVICRFVVLDNFFLGNLVVLISHCGIAVFSESVECSFFLTFWTILKIILQVVYNESKSFPV